jgi:hypothetical protein
MTVLEYQARVRRMTFQLRRVNEALSRWEEIACQPLVPREFRRRIRRPRVSRASLKELQAMIGIELHRLEMDFQSAMPFSLN